MQAEETFRIGSKIAPDAVAQQWEHQAATRKQLVEVLFAARKAFFITDDGFAIGGLVQLGIATTVWSDLSKLEQTNTKSFAGQHKEESDDETDDDVDLLAIKSGFGKLQATIIESVTMYVRCHLAAVRLQAPEVFRVSSELWTGLNSPEMAKELDACIKKHSFALTSSDDFEAVSAKLDGLDAKMQQVSTLAAAFEKADAAEKQRRSTGIDGHMVAYEVFAIGRGLAKLAELESVCRFDDLKIPVEIYGILDKAKGLLDSKCSKMRKAESTTFIRNIGAHVKVTLDDVLWPMIEKAVHEYSGAAAQEMLKIKNEITLKEQAEQATKASDHWKDWEKEFDKILAGDKIIQLHANLSAWDKKLNVIKQYEEKTRPLLRHQDSSDVKSARGVMLACSLLQSFFKDVGRSSRAGAINDAIRKLRKDDEYVPKKVKDTAIKLTGAGGSGAKKL